MGDLRKICTKKRTRKKTVERTKCGRDSNFEVLRIVAMLMIVCFHIIDHSVYPQLTNQDSIARMGNGYFNYPHIYRKLWIMDLGMILGPLGNAIFILISGYFMAGKEEINITKISKKLVQQLGFATLTLIAGSFLWYCFTGMGTDAYAALADISYFNSMSWFVGYYFLVVLFGKLFLNKFLAGISQRRYVEFLAVLFTLVSLGWTGGLLDSLISGLRILVTGIFLYSMGGYIKKYNPLEKIRSGAFLAYFILEMGLVCLSAYNARALSIENFMRSGGSGEYIQIVPGFSNHHILVITTGIFLFELFRRIRIKENRLINYVGGGDIHGIPTSRQRSILQLVGQNRLDQAFV